MAIKWSHRSVIFTQDSDMYVVILNAEPLTDKLWPSREVSWNTLTLPYTRCGIRRVVGVCPSGVELSGTTFHVWCIFAFSLISSILQCIQSDLNHHWWSFYDIMQCLTSLMWCSRCKAYGLIISKPCWTIMLDLRNLLFRYIMLGWNFWFLLKCSLIV